MRHLLVLGLSSIFGVFGALACSGKTVVQPYDELACDNGHGCGVAFCTCADDVLLLSSLCASEECVETEEICERRCVERGGVKANAGHPEPQLAAPLCGQLCERLRASGCQTGCQPLFDSCAAPDPQCSAEVVGLFECMAQEAILGCDSGAITISGCSADIGFCAPAEAGEAG